MGIDSQDIYPHPPHLVEREQERQTETTKNKPKKYKKGRKLKKEKGGNKESERKNKKRQRGTHRWSTSVCAHRLHRKRGWRESEKKRQRRGV